MSRVVSGVAKILFISIFALIILDATTMLLDITSAQSKVDGVANMTKMVVMKNNYVSDANKKVLQDNLDKVCARSNWMVSAKLDPDNTLSTVGSYGDFKTIVIRTTISTRVVGIVGNMRNWKQQSRTTVNDNTYQAVCLQYLKS